MALKQIGTRVDETVIENLDKAVSDVLRQKPDIEFNRSKLLASIINNWNEGTQLNGLNFISKGENKNAESEIENLESENIDLKTELVKLRESRKNLVPEQLIEAEKERTNELQEQLHDLKEKLQNARSEIRNFDSRNTKVVTQKVERNISESDAIDENKHLRSALREIGNEFADVSGMFKNRAFFHLQNKIIQITTRL
jgi:chromosome segregation ATPase